MLVNINDLTIGEIKNITDIIKAPHGALSNRNAEFAGDVCFTGWAALADDNTLAVNGEISFKLSCGCDLCNKTFERDFKLPLNVTYARDPIDSEYGLNGEEANIDAAASDTIILELPYRLVCTPECKGLCYKCGADLNKKKCKCKTDEKINNPFAVLKDYRQKD